MLVYPKPALRLSEADVAELANVPSPSASPPPSRAKLSRTNAFFSTTPVAPPSPSGQSRTNSFFGAPPSPISPPPSPMLASAEPTPKASPKDVWWAKLGRRKREDTIPAPSVLPPSDQSEGFKFEHGGLPSPSMDSPLSSGPSMSIFGPPPKESPVELMSGQTIASSQAELVLIRPLGKGSFSTVWLARDTSSVPLAVQAKRRTRELRARKSSLWGSTVIPDATNTNPDSHLTPEAQEVDLLRRHSGKKKSTSLALGVPRDFVQGVRPIGSDRQSRAVSVVLDGYSNGTEGVSRASSTSSVSSLRPQEGLVAVKLVERSVLESPDFNGAMTYEDREKDRTRVSFIREVEVLKHISHPNIAPLLAQLSTPSHHMLVLPYAAGGDLFALVHSDTAWPKLRESVLQRVFNDLVNAVGWMHSVGLVHRDIKLENILVVTTAFNELSPDSPAPSLETVSLASPRHHRFSSSSSFTSLHGIPYPPLIKLTDFGLSRFISPSSPLLRTRCGSEAYAAPELVIKSVDGYDARETDSWACGVCLYELACRSLPFGSEDQADRRKWLFSIALGQYTWPNEHADSPSGEERMGHSLSFSPDIRRVVSKLLVRDVKKRTAVADLIDDPWVEDSFQDYASSVGTDEHDHFDEDMTRITISPSEDSHLHCHFAEDYVDDTPGDEWIVDVPEKDSIARQELL